MSLGIKLSYKNASHFIYRNCCLVLYNHVVFKLAHPQQRMLTVRVLVSIQTLSVLWGPTTL